MNLSSLMFNAHLILPFLITGATFSEEYSSSSSTLCDVLQSRLHRPCYGYNFYNFSGNKKFVTVNCGSYEVAVCRLYHICKQERGASRSWQGGVINEIDWPLFIFHIMSLPSPFVWTGGPHFYISRIQTSAALSQQYRAAISFIV